MKSREEAIEWVKRAPNPMPGTDSEIEIRQVFEEEDFGDLAKKVPDVFEAEARFREDARRKEQAQKAGKK